MNFSNFFNEYEYQSSKGWVGYKKQLQEQGMDIDFHVENGKGFVPGSSVPEPPKPQPKTRCLTFTAVEANSTIKLTAAGTPPNVRLQYSTDGYTWDDYSINTTIQLVSIGDSVMFRGENSFFNADDPDANPYNYFVMTGKISGSGDVTSLLNGVGGDMESALPSTSFYRLFYNCSNLTKAPNLPSTTLSSSCYKEMFRGCTSLTEAPELPAITLANGCYYDMFRGCTSLTEIPELPATTLVSSCYSGMFRECTSLTEAPELPATTLANNCYYSMFRGCTSLTEIPELPATTLVSSCYSGMFQGCTSLTEAPELPATTLANNCYYSMFQGCSSLSGNVRVSGNSAYMCCGNMFMDCINIESAVVDIPVLTAFSSELSNMFYGCNSLNYVEASFSSIPTDNEGEPGSSTGAWLFGVSPTGTFKWNGPVPYNGVRNASSIPSGWTVEKI